MKLRLAAPLIAAVLALPIAQGCARFGGINGPKYSVVDNYGFHKIDIKKNHDILLGPEFIEETRVISARMDNLEETLSKLEIELTKETAQNVYGRSMSVYHPKMAKDLEECFKSWAVLALYARSRINDGSITRRELEQEIKSSSKLIKDPVGLSKIIFGALTRQNFPSSTRIEESTLLNSNAAAHYDAARNMIRYRKDDSVLVLIRLLHEYGHLIAQHDEQNLFRTKDIGVLEEAHGYAFAYAGLQYLAQKEETREIARIGRKIFDLYILCMATRFYGGDESQPHHEAAAIFLAADGIWGNPKRIANHFSRLKGSKLANLDPRIKERVEYNKSLIFYPREKNITLAVRLWRLNEGYKALRKRCIGYSAKAE